MRRNDYSLLRERALNNFELLLSVWNIEYQKIGQNEYDFLSPTRNDKSFGACRFNVAKGVGSDFAGISFKRSDFEQIGAGFSKEDFSGFSNFGETNPSFDIIGLAQRVYNSNSYSEGAIKLKQELDNIDGGKIDTTKLLEQAAIRAEKILVQREKMRSIAERSWKWCKDIQNTIGENYLKFRGINMEPWDIEPNMKFHSQVFNKELETYIPAIIFKVSDKPDGELKAIHRIWIARDGSRKARLSESKKALGSIEGNAIWFGSPCDKLYIAEGPEEALTLRYGFEREFVASTVYSTNFHALKIPDYVKKVVLCRDYDPAGLSAVKKAYKAYKNQISDVSIMRQPNV